MHEIDDSRNIECQSTAGFIVAKTKATSLEYIIIVISSKTAMGHLFHIKHSSRTKKNEDLCRFCTVSNGKDQRLADTGSSQGTKIRRKIASQFMLEFGFSSEPTVVVCTIQIVTAIDMYLYSRGVTQWRIICQFSSLIPTISTRSPSFPTIPNYSL